MLIGVGRGGGACIVVGPGIASLAGDAPESSLQLVIGDGIS